jgi:hypothetical protein
MRVQLFNKVSEDILKNNDNLKDIKTEVKIYSDMFDELVRNAYELLTMGDDCPLFVLLHTIDAGKDDFCMNQAEFDAEIAKYKAQFQKKFGIDFDSIKSE